MNAPGGPTKYYAGVYFRDLQGRAVAYCRQCDYKAEAGDRAKSLRAAVAHANRTGHVVRFRSTEELEVRPKPTPAKVPS